MADTKRPVEVKIYPAGWESAPESERFSVSYMGHIVPKIYVLISEVFALPDDADKNTILKSMVAGLEFALSQFPILVGTLEMDEKNGRMWVSKKRYSSLNLHVKYMLSEDEFPSFDVLAQKHFPASMLVGHLLLPTTVTAKQLHSPLGDNNEEGLAISTVQINFIRGGLIIAAAIHHSVSDGPGCDGFLTTWAQNSAASARGVSFVPIEPIGTANSPLDLPNLASPRASGKDNDLKSKQYLAIKDAGGPMPPPPPGFQMPEFSQQMWHFSKSKLSQLKEAASLSTKTNRDDSPPCPDRWISTYDAVMALLWGGITRSRVDLFHPDRNATTILVHALNTRKLWDPPLPDRFLCVASAPARCEPMLVQEMITSGESALQTMAAAIRTSINEMTAQHVNGLLEWVAGRTDRRWLAINMNSFLGMDLGASSWQGMSSYTAHDFGFGLPRALRWPSPSMDGFVFVYPARGHAADLGVDTNSDGDDEGIEVCVCLEAGCQQRLLQDKLVLAYAEPRGL